MRSSYAAIISALFLAEMTATFEPSMLYAALPTLIREFGDPVTAGWLVTIHMLVGSAAAILAGRLGDIKGRRTMMMMLLAVSAVGSVMSAITTNFAFVFAGRALQGLSVAILPLSIGVLRESLPEDRVPVAIGLMTTAQGMGIAIGLVLGGMIIDNLNWHWLFALSAVLLAVSWGAVKLLIPARPGIPPKAPIDWIEGGLPVPGLVAVLLGVSLSKEAGWLAPQVLGLVVVGLVIVVYWVRRSLRAPEPFIDLRILGTRNVALTNAINVLLAFGTMQLVFVFSTYTQAPGWTMAGLGMSATVAGLAKLPSNILSFFAGPLSGLLTQKFGSRLPVVTGAMLAGSGWVIAMGLPTSLIGVIALLCVISFGTTILNAAIPNVIVGAVSDERTSEAIGTMSVLRGLASAIGVQIIAVLLATSTVTAPEGGAAFPSAAGYRLTMGWIAVLTFAGAAIALLLRVRQHGAMETATTLIRPRP